VAYDWGQIFEDTTVAAAIQVDPRNRRWFDAPIRVETPAVLAAWARERRRACGVHLSGPETPAPWTTCLVLAIRANRA
jgi:hypothetical protein